MRATLYRPRSDGKPGKDPVAFMRAGNGRLVLGTLSHGGLTFHSTGGISIVGWPRCGGTTIAWGQRLKARMDEHAVDCVVYRLGPVSVYRGEDF